MAHTMTHECTNPKECKRKAQNWEENQNTFCPVGQKEFDEFYKKYIKKEACIELDRHFEKRALERCVNESEMKEVFEMGWVIERNKSLNNISIVLLGYVGQNYRPLHVVFNAITKTKWVAVTVYDPKSHHWKWNDSFDKRVCFCNCKEDY